MIDFAGYTFDDNKLAVVCKHVHEGLPVLLFSHDSDGDIQFLCGAEGHETDDFLMVCLSHLLEHIRSMPHMPVVEPGQLAERQDVGQPWVVNAAPA